jgi:diguanylate cyclase (GGDEF)-like protein
MKKILTTLRQFSRDIVQRFSILNSASDYTLTAEDKKRIFSQIIAKSMKQALIVNIIELPIVFLTYIVLLSVHQSIYVHLWLGYHLLASTTLRFTCLYLYHHNFRHQDVYFWRKMFTIIAALVGISWGIVGSVLMPVNAPAAQLYIILLLFALASGGMPVLAPLLLEYTIFLLALMIPFMGWMFLQGGTILLFGILLPCWIALSLIAAYHTRNLIIKALLLQFENKDLYNNTLKAKRELEQINNSLIFEIRLRKSIEKRLESIATHDKLTGLPNRVLLHTFLNETFAKADLLKKMVAVVFIDMDNFKPINDTLGHDIGDKLLAAIGERLRYRIRKADFVCRIGGDEFVIVITNLQTIQTISRIVENILHAIAERYTIGQHDFSNITASAGISLYPQDAMTFDQLIKFADIAMYKAKERGGNQFEYYNIKKEKSV